MKQVQIREHQIIQRLDLMAEDFLRLPHQWKHHPMPKTSAEDLREVMADENHNGYPKKSNNIDYAGRAVSKNFKDRTAALLGSVKLLTDNQSWYWDSMIFQVPATGWTAWHNGGEKPRHFVRFIHNSGVGFTNYIKDGKRIKIEDQHNPETTKNWTCITGYLDGNTTWMSDRNLGDHPRVIFDMSIDGKYHGAVEQFVEFIETIHV